MGRHGDPFQVLRAWLSFCQAQVGNNPPFLKLSSRSSSPNRWKGERGLFKGSGRHLFPPPSEKRSWLLNWKSFWQTFSALAKTPAVKQSQRGFQLLLLLFIGFSSCSNPGRILQESKNYTKTGALLTVLDGKFLGRAFSNGQKGQIAGILAGLFQGLLQFLSISFSQWWLWGSTVAKGDFGGGEGAEAEIHTPAVLGFNCVSAK